ncbi:hypothetical protein NDU88_009623 [Pleurodeles waltl]|uniref:Secreted protein n=1 Tax=Pleurodeles waltl TaxID=8319 RepID=A0AAV7PZX7_PLEWA|nr:hypothetical protein NDU88_009623 [Pleurodeles waltl]
MLLLSNEARVVFTFTSRLLECTPAFLPVRVFVCGWPAFFPARVFVCGWLSFQRASLCATLVRVQFAFPFHVCLAQLR